MDYILAPKERVQGCIFCGFESPTPELSRERHIICVTKHAYVCLNKYPFAAGHLLVIPHRHIDTPEALEVEEHDALMRLVRLSCGRLREAVKAEGLNVGMNLGAVAGAGVAAHLHVHIVPRWSGDRNFMPVLADVHVMPQALDATHAHLTKYFGDVPTDL
jgi:ATP adenylyltransferase